MKNQIEEIKKTLKSKYKDNMECWINYHDYDVSIQGKGMSILCYDHELESFKFRSGGQGWSDQEWNNISDEKTEKCINNAIIWAKKNYIEVAELIEFAEKL